LRQLEPLPDQLRFGQLALRQQTLVVAVQAPDVARMPAWPPQGVVQAEVGTVDRRRLIDLTLLEKQGAEGVASRLHPVPRLVVEQLVVPLDGTIVRDAAPEPVLAGGADPSDLAYVIYTSGSTGRPKGTMNSHRGIVNRLLWMQAQYGLTPADRVLQKTPFSFDVSVWEFFWPLMTGARLVMARPGGHQDPAYLVETRYAGS
jgi:acyl-coenzyme A synthetase/AMP-(fatty) acid ligase